MSVYILFSVIYMVCGMLVGAHIMKCAEKQDTSGARFFAIIAIVLTIVFVILVQYMPPCPCT
jgi:DMSO reductase anchor subunit